MASSSSKSNCYHCGTVLAQVLTCSRCKARHYCSKECQKKDWSKNSIAAHKHNCFPHDWVDKFWSFLEESYTVDHAITKEEYKEYPLAVHRQAASLLKYLDEENCVDSPLEPFMNDTLSAIKLACLYFLDTRLLWTGRGVRTKVDGALGYVIDKVGEPMSPKRSYKVELVGSGTVIKCTPAQVSLLSLNDMRHRRGGMEYVDDDEAPYLADKSLHPYEAMIQRKIANGYPRDLPKNVSWEYQDANTKEWKKYHLFLQEEMETMYILGSPHFLYRPDAPHCIGGYEVRSLNTEGDSIIGDPALAVQHDMATRQVILKVTDGEGFLSMERDLFTGMERLIRRLGPPPKHIDEECLPIEIPQNVLTLPKSRYCGLCHSTANSLVQMECCGGYVCDTEDQYEIGSYEREGQCARNHRLNSICFWHKQEHHSCSGSSDDWKSCQKCQDFFSPFDYAVKALPMAMSGTCRRYNFDDNVRTDLDLHATEFPKCAECQQPVDTTEETTRTISMRKATGSPLLCKVHGGGFGVINMEQFNQKMQQR